ncbi:protein kinase [Nonomuraea sp. NPDC050643]|uniref:serine/threonine-protein kinase n=1 Tax=Nonomuraea sp. NPDC050643 TaxID=3155660 RepID=UPI00340F95F3
MPNVEPLRGGDPAAVGPYRLVGRLGAGGHGVVYLGQARNGTPVAIKVLREGLAVDDRLARAISAARKVEPFCLAQVLDASTSGRPYIVSEYVDGPSLQQAGRRGGAELQRLAVTTATALDAIHQAGVVHGDFTPSNVLLGPDGARVVDFGVAGALGSGMKATSNIVGTPAYMAPEQLAGKPVGAAADVFSWASVLVYAATGVPPFGDDSLPAVINRILREEPHIGELPGPLREVVTACLVKDPGARPAMRDVLLRLAAPSRHPATPPPASDPGWEHTPDRSWEAREQSADSLWEPAADRPRKRASERPWEQPAGHPQAGPSRKGRAPQGAGQRASARQPDAAHQGPTQDFPAHATPEPPQDPSWEAGQHQTPGQNHQAAQHQHPAARPDAHPSAQHGFGQAPDAHPGAQHGHPHAAEAQRGGGHAADPQGGAYQGSGPVSDPHEGPGPATSPLQALFDLSSPIEQPSAAHPPAPLGAPVAPDLTAPLGAPVPPMPPVPPGGAPVAGGPMGAYGAPPAGDEGGTGGQNPAPAPRSRGRRVKTAMIAGVSGVCVLALAGAIIWLTPTTPTPKTTNIAGITDAPTTEPAATPRPTRTRGTTRPTPQTDGTPSTVPTGDPTGTGSPSAGANRLRVVYVRPAGTRNGTCWAGGEVALQALVRRTGDPVTITYSWIVDGVQTSRASAVVSGNGQRYLAASRPLRSTGGTHSVTLRITSPVAAQRTVSVTMCDDGTTQ